MYPRAPLWCTDDKDTTMAVIDSHPESTQTDPRPAVAIGHIGPHRVTDLDAAVGFFEQLGMRTVAVMPAMAILELRGGTHLIVRRVDQLEIGAQASFDLMVDDIDATHAALAAAGLSPTAIERGGIHSSFTVTDPSGTIVAITSSHAMGPV
ncbi:MAG: VOC family protein [Actinomycetota bacterium]